MGNLLFERLADFIRKRTAMIVISLVGLCGSCGISFSIYAKEADFGYSILCAFRLLQVCLFDFSTNYNPK